MNMEFWVFYGIMRKTTAPSCLQILVQRSIIPTYTNSSSLLMKYTVGYMGLFLYGVRTCVCNLIRLPSGGNLGIII